MLVSTVVCIHQPLSPNYCLMMLEENEAIQFLH